MNFLLDFNQICIFTKFKVIGTTAQEGVCQYQTDLQGKSNPSQIIKPEISELFGLGIPSQF